MSEQEKTSGKKIAELAEQLNEQQLRDAELVLQGILIGASAGKRE